MNSLPTVSDPAAMADFPQARGRERDRLLDCLRLWPGMRVLDIQAAGGYLSDEIYRRLGGQVHCVCVEPCDALRARLSPRYQRCADPVDALTSIADASVDAAVSLVGLHHSASHERSLEQALRVLRPGGELAVCEVEAGSQQAAWLNDFVDRYCPAGHQGNFPAAGNLGTTLKALDMRGVWEVRQEVPWVFARRAHLLCFLKGLFGLVIDDAGLNAGIAKYLQVSERGGQVWLAWRLIYAYGRKATGENG